jgi:hypothetical protein
MPAHAANRRCTVCGSRLRLVAVVYGLPTTEAMESAERGDVVIGGCIPGGPTHVCAVCRETTHEPTLPPRAIDAGW